MDNKITISGVVSDIVAYQNYVNFKIRSETIKLSASCFYKDLNGLKMLNGDKVEVKGYLVSYLPSKRPTRIIANKIRGIK